MADEEIPVLSLPESQKERYDEIKKKFQERFGEEPAFFARAPGRVNLIGEHIDYCGYSVLPMAVEQDIVMAVLPDQSGGLTLVNTDSSYTEFSGNVMQFTITADVPHWYKYVLCGVKGVQEQFCSVVTNGFKAMVDGTVPRSAGLSSSSALVCCASLAMLKANQWPMTKTKISEVCAKSEHYIGTIGGGMDQAISFTARQGKAKLIEFNPLRTTDVQLPGNASFVVSNSLAEMNKAATPHFNIRVVECRLAAQVLAHSKSVPWREVKRLGELQKRLGVSLDEMMTMVGAVLHSEPYSKTEVCELLGSTPEELAETSLSPNTLHVESFKLHDRATHVYGEAKRVLRFKEVCDSQPEDALQQLGQLMNESHASCRDMYECSHPELDSLTDTCRKHGAVGSRMTGAGWGGCTVSILPKDQVSSLLEGVKTDYYEPQPRKLEKVKEALFATAPGGGAAFYKY